MLAPREIDPYKLISDLLDEIGLLFLKASDDEEAFWEREVVRDCAEQIELLAFGTHYSSEAKLIDDVLALLKKVSPARAVLLERCLDRKVAARIQMLMDRLVSLEEHLQRP